MDIKMSQNKHYDTWYRELNLVPVHWMTENIEFWTRLVKVK